MWFHISINKGVDWWLLVLMMKIQFCYFLKHYKNSQSQKQFQLQNYVTTLYHSQSLTDSPTRKPSENLSPSPGAFLLTNEIQSWLIFGVLEGSPPNKERGAWKVSSPFWYTISIKLKIHSYLHLPKSPLFYFMWTIPIITLPQSLTQFSPPK